MVFSRVIRLITAHRLLSPVFILRAHESVQVDWLSKLETVAEISQWPSQCLKT